MLAAPVHAVSPVAGVEVEDMTSSDGASIARVRVKLDRPASARVHSARNFIFVDVERAIGLDGRTAAPAVTRPVPAANRHELAPRPAAALRAATVLRGVRALPDGAGVVITADGELVPTSVQDAKDLPPRVVLDFANVGTERGVPAVTEVGNGGIERVRVATNSRSPLVTRVVIDLARQIAYRVESAGEELRVLFGGAQAPEQRTATAEPATAPDAGAPRADAADAQPADGSAAAPPRH